MKVEQKNRGFTLLELLIVIGIIAVLSMLVLGASSYVASVSRVKRVQMSCAVLESALRSYRSEYNEWPDEFGNASVVSEKDIADGKTTKTYKSDNNTVFAPLRVTSSGNSNNIRFLDETAFLAYYSGGSGKTIGPLSEVPANSPFKLVFIPKNGKLKDANGNPYCFEVKINHANDNVTVSAPGLTAGDMEDD